MQARKSIETLAAEIQRQQSARRDFIVPSNKMAMVLEQARPVVEFQTNGGRDRFPVNGYAHGQIAGKLSIPKPYYDRMLENAPDLLAANVNRWLQGENKSHMVRTLDNTVRAFLSDRYRPLDNDIILEAVYPHLQRAQVQILSCEITQTHMYLQCISPRVAAAVPNRVGDIVNAGLTISNSEVGAGSVWFASLLYFLRCLNGQQGSTDFRKYHIGKRVGNQEGAEMIAFSDRTRLLDDRAFMSALDDLTKRALDDLNLTREMKMITDATGREVSSTALADTVTEITKRYNLTENDGKGILDRIIRGGDLTQYAIASAVTNLANDGEAVPDYEKVIELQKVGADIMGLNDGAWTAIQKIETDN